MTLLSTTKKTYRGIELDTLIDSDGCIVSLNELFDVSAPKLVLINNYNIIKYSIIEALLKLEDWHEKTEKGDNNQTYSIRKDYITLHHDKRNTVNIASFEVKNHQKFKDFAQAKNLEDHDGEQKMTAAMDGKQLALRNISTCTNEFSQLHFFRSVFPKPTNSELEILEGARLLSGGFMACKKAGEYANVHSYDRKSAYTGQLLKSRIPYGRPKRYKTIEGIPSRRWFILQIAVTWAEPIIYDFFDIQKLWLSGNCGEITISIPQEIYFVLEKYYRIKYKIIDCLSYKTREQPFKDFPDIAISTDPEEVRKRNKARLNLFFGSLGRAQKFTECTYSLDKDKIKCDFKGRSELSGNACDYMPLYLYISIGAKVDFVNEISKFWGDVIYCNTDGFLTQKVIDLSAFNSRFRDVRGTFQHRGFYRRCAIKDISNYYLADSNEGDKYICSGSIAAAPVDYDTFCTGEWITVSTLTEYGFVNAQTRRALSLKGAIDLHEQKQREKRRFAERAFAIRGRDIIPTEPVIIDDYPVDVLPSPDDVPPPPPEGVTTHNGELALACRGARPHYFRALKKFSLQNKIYQKGEVAAFALDVDNIDAYVYMLQKKYIEIIRNISFKNY